MSSSSSTLARPPSTPSKSNESRSSRRKTAENWDEDFEFNIRPQPKPVDTRRAPENTTAPNHTTVSKGRASPDSFGSWDDSPPQRPMLLSTPHSSSSSKSPAPIPLNLGSSLPRDSPSHSSNLPHARSSSPLSVSPIPPTSHSSSSTSHQPLIPYDPPPDLPRPRSGSTNATMNRKKLLKRHPSSSFVPLMQQDTSKNSSTGSITHPSRSTPHLPRSPSSERMPPPPIPLGLIRTRSKGKGRPVSRGPDGVRISNIPFSPSQDAMAEVERKPSFWKRLSGVPADRKAEDSQQIHRRRRSSSVGAHSSPTKPSSPHPPLPPFPPNLRSASAASNVSFGSQISSTSASSSNRSGPASALSSILRRSTSSLSKRSDNSGKTPPSSYNPAFSPSSIPASSPVGIPRREPTPTSPPSSHSFSRGFHLPSPSPGSPYSPALPSLPGPLMPPPLPHSNSFPAPPKSHTTGLSEDEMDFEDNDATPRRRRKIRPVSALPAPRSISKTWEGEGWKGFGEVKSSTDLRKDSQTEPRSPFHRVTASEIPNPSSPRSAGFASATSSTLRRLGSISKKHGRRLSGGFKFGTGSSASSNESRRGSAQPLETVVGSPSKPSRPPVPPPDFPASASEAVFGTEIRAGSVSAPNSSFKASTVGKKEGQAIGMVASISEDAGLSARKEKHRRRKSGGDLIIPAHVREKQKLFEQGRGAVRDYAAGVEALIKMIDTHAQLKQKVFATGSELDRRAFTALEAEFEQHWEMAILLVDVGATTATPAAQPPMSAQSSPARTRRITLASDEAKAAGDALSRLALNAHRDGVPQTLRSSSLPDPEFEVGLPVSSPPDRWRASTGRSDLSKRQLQILRTILSNDPRPGLGPRTASTLSVTSTGSVLPTISANHFIPSTQARTPSSRSISGVTFPSPPESGYFVPSTSFPSPVSASNLAQPTRPPLEKRRSSKAGLSGLKEFLRSLKRTPSPIKPQFPLARNTRPPSRQDYHLSPPTSPTTPSTPGFEEVQYPTSRSSFSMMRPPSPAISQQQTSQQSKRTSRKLPSPEKNSSKRPSLKSVFRTSSGNWSELVRGGTPQTQAPPLPSPNIRKSTDGGHDGQPISGMPNHPKQDGGLNQSPRPSKTPTSASFNLGPKSWKSPKKGSLNDSQKYQDINAKVPTQTPMGKGGEVDRTLRPVRKSRILGLGLPGSPSSPKLPQAYRDDSGGTQTSSDMTRSTSTSTAQSTSRYQREEAGTEYAKDGGEDADEEGNLEIAFTLENLVQLSKYLSECEGRLQEWRVKAEQVIEGGLGRGERV